MAKLDLTEFGSTTGITITRNQYTFTITFESDETYEEQEVPLVEFCKALGLQPIPEEVRSGPSES